MKPQELYSLLCRILGCGEGASPINLAVGVTNNGAFLPLLAWLLAHASETIELRISVGALALIVAGLYLLLELGRRSYPGERRRKDRG